MNFLKSILPRKKKEEPAPSLAHGPTRPIDNAFKEYIHNEIPARFIDTSSLQFVSRKDVYHIFHSDIAKVTEEQIRERIRNFQSDPFATYQPRRETVLSQIIQEIVKYDILSHRWNGEADEPTYQDVSGGKHTISKFRKLVGFCNTSRNLGRKLAWVDTCCIDETNPAERSEAIHAMYKWYANSHLCIVYLAESASYEDWDGDSWFTRGWTLQEFLAPKRLKFYGKNWQPLAPSEIGDDKRCQVIMPLLERVTGIPQSVLSADNSQGVEGCSFWEIMSWASNRRTTRIEDRAYCLVGLFQVSLHIAYGEGQRAFFRLLEAIVTKNPSWDVFAWSGQPSKDHFSLPSSPASYPRFQPDMGKERAGVQELKFTANALSLKSLPPIPMRLRSSVAQQGKRKICLHLESRHDDKYSFGKFGDLVVECGSTRLETIQGAHELCACIINHHAMRNREQGKLVVGKSYICFLLYRNDIEGEGGPWLKLATDNLLQISYFGSIDSDSEKTVSDLDFVIPTHSSTGPTGFTSPLVTIFIQSPPSA